MIYTKLTREDALELLELGKYLHGESRYKDTKYNVQTIWNLLNMISQYPERYQISYYKNKENKIIGFFIGQVTLEYFTGNIIASDLGMYVLPEYRGSRIFLRLLQSFEDWAKSTGAKKIILYHSTGINPEKSKNLFPKLGYENYGYIFDKEL